MIRDGEEISRATFLKSVDPDEMLDLERRLGYERDSRKGLTMAKDWAVAYYRSTVRGCPAVYFVWSAIEHVFTDLACVRSRPSGGEEPAAMAGPDPGGVQKTFTLVDQATREVPHGLRDISEGHPIFRNVERVLDGPAHHSELEVGQKMTVLIRTVGRPYTYSIWRTA
jgi:hypothetical protein